MITPTPEDEAALEATKAPLMEHLIELRKRLVWSMLSFGVCFIACFSVSTRIMDFLMKPMAATTNSKTAGLISFIVRSKRQAQTGSTASNRVNS